MPRGGGTQGRRAGRGVIPRPVDGLGDVFLID
jgi:hypothetical protein